MLCFLFYNFFIFFTYCFLLFFCRPRIGHPVEVKYLPDKKGGFHLTVCQFLNVCGFLCPLVQWLSCCNVYKRICRECTVAKSGLRISLFPIHPLALHAKLLGNLIVSWHLISTFKTAFDVTRTIPYLPQVMKVPLCPHFSIAR